MHCERTRGAGATNYQPAMTAHNLGFACELARTHVPACSPHDLNAESIEWRAGDVQRAAGYFGRVLKFHNNVIASRPPVSVSGADAGSRPSAKLTRPIGTISCARNVLGANATLTTGANIAATIHSLQSETVYSNASATIAGASALLQRWMCHERLPQFRQAYTGSAMRHRPELQRWTRGRFKSLCFQPPTISRAYCKERT
jgi:hypothetical protein